MYRQDSAVPLRNLKFKEGGKIGNINKPLKYSAISSVIGGASVFKFVLF